MSDLKPYISKLADGRPLTSDEAQAVFTIMMSGQATPAQIGGILMALRVRGETIEEITGAVKAMRAKMLTVDAPDDVIDIVGTGGDGSGSYNVSTATAFVVAGLGVKVAKHGNRALSSRSGAADALRELGVNVDASAVTIARSIREVGLGFMFAPAHHTAMRHVGPARIELATRTIFNILGPLANPAGARRQLLGVFSPQWLRPIAETLKTLGSTALWVVHGNGMDEISTADETQVVALEKGEISHFTITPEQAGLKRVGMEALKGGDPADNASALRALLEGAEGAYRDIVLFNAAASLIIAEKATDLTQGVEMARMSIDSGRAATILERLVEVSNRDE